MKIITNLFIVILLRSKVFCSLKLIDRLSREWSEKTYEKCAKRLSGIYEMRKLVHNFWTQPKENHISEMGCVLQCMLKKRGLFDAQGSPIHKSIQDMFRHNGASPEETTTMMEGVRVCWTHRPNTGDVCKRTLGISQCYKDYLIKLNWMPRLILTPPTYKKKPTHYFLRPAWPYKYKLVKLPKLRLG